MAHRPKASSLHWQTEAYAYLEMNCLCGGSYPSLDEQVRRLRDESEMPYWSSEIYRKLIENANLQLHLCLLRRITRTLRETDL
jgi:hypothetical protein